MIGRITGSNYAWREVFLLTQLDTLLSPIAEVLTFQQSALWRLAIALFNIGGELAQWYKRERCYC